jgi:hypothetical protein
LYEALDAGRLEESCPGIRPEMWSSSYISSHSFITEL